MRTHRFLPVIAVLFAVLVWGISFVATKVVLDDIPPVSIAFFRQMIAIAPLLLLLRANGESLRLAKGELRLFFVAAFFGLVLYFVFENTGLQYTTASNASMLVAAIPVFTLVIETIIHKKKLALFTLAMILVSIAGVYLVLFEDGLPVWWNWCSWPWWWHRFNTIGQAGWTVELAPGQTLTLEYQWHYFWG